MAPVVAAYQALRGVSFVVAVTFVSQVKSAMSPLRQPAAADGLPWPGALGALDRPHGEARRLTLGGNRRARRVLVEGAWSFRHPARVTEAIRVRLERPAEGGA